MEKTIRISNYQLFTILVCFMLGSSIIVNPAAAAKQDGWLAFLFGWSGGFVLMLLYTYIALLNPGKNLIEILRYNFGKVLGSIISIVYILYFIHLAALVLRNFGEFILTVSYPDTPMLFVISGLMLVVCYAVKKNIEIIGRISEIFNLLFVCVLLFVFFALFSMYKFENFKPFFVQGILPIIKGALGTLTFPFGETVAFLMVFPYVKKQENLKKSSLLGVAMVGFLLFTAIIRNQMVLGTAMLSRDVFPSHIAFRLIPGLDVDPLLDLNFTMGGIVKVSICLLAATRGIVDLFNLNNYKILVLPLAAFCVSLSILLYDNVNDMITWAGEIWPYYSIPFQIILPIIILTVSLIRKKEQKKECEVIT